MDDTAASVPSPTARHEQRMIDYAFLRQQGIQYLERLTGFEWTDFNSHDPGITILEQLCYALTDLSYRTEYELPDLLSREGDDPYASIYTPAQILPTSPVTLTDLRKLVIDVPGVKNAWIDIVDESSARFDAARNEVSTLANDHHTGAFSASPNVSEIRIKGLLRVRIEKSNISNSNTVIRAVAQRLHRYRGLGQDFQAIEILEHQSIGLRATLEIDAVEDASKLLASVYRNIADYMSPSVSFHSLDDMLERGYRVDEIFEGPLLDSGFIDPHELAHVERRTAVRISDLIQVLMSVPGVAAVKELRFHDAEGEDWLRSIDANKTPWFDLDVSDIQLEKNTVQLDKQSIRKKAERLFTPGPQQTTSPHQNRAIERDLQPPPGRDRNVANYYSVQQQFPMVYGIGAAGLPQSATPERKAQAKQLKAYMLFYDQLLANQFAQLANVGKLFSFHDESSDSCSYFSQPVDDDGTLGLDEVRDASLNQTLQQLTEESSFETPSMTGKETGARRRNRFLDHMLARFGEQFGDYALMQPELVLKDDITTEEQLASDKRAFLRDYPRISRDRGTAFNYLEAASDENMSGLERTLRRKLGVNAVDEKFYLVEHILMRPIPGDKNQRGPLFRAAQVRDPYSLQVSLIFPQDKARYKNKAFVEQSVREETPAHLTVHVIWKDEEAMSFFKSAYDEWLQRLRTQRREELGL